MSSTKELGFMDYLSMGFNSVGEAVATAAVATKEAVEYVAHVTWNGIKTVFNFVVNTAKKIGHGAIVAVQYAMYYTGVAAAYSWLGIKKTGAAIAYAAEHTWDGVVSAGKFTSQCAVWTWGMIRDGTVKAWHLTKATAVMTWQFAKSAAVLAYAFLVGLGEGMFIYLFCLSFILALATMYVMAATFVIGLFVVVTEAMAETIAVYCVWASFATAVGLILNHVFSKSEPKKASVKSAWPALLNPDGDDSDLLKEAVRLEDDEDADEGSRKHHRKPTKV